MNRRGPGQILGTAGQTRWVIWGQAGRRRAPGNQPYCQPRRLGNWARWCPPQFPASPLTGCRGLFKPGPALAHLGGSQPSQCLGALPAGGSWLGENTAGKEGRAGRSPWGVGRQEQTQPASFRPWGQSPVWAFLMPPEMLVPGCELQALLGSGGCAVPPDPRGAVVWPPHILGGVVDSWALGHNILRVRRQL